MPHINELRDSKFLKQADVTPPVLVTIKDCIQENVAKEGAPEQMKWCLTFHEVEKPLVLNSTNGQIIAGVCGSENTEDWAGHKVVLFADPTISFQGKLVGGIRARAPKVKAAAPIQPKPVAKPVPPPVDPGQEESDTPF